MPSKALSRSRTWGTRFDSLLSPPPQSVMSSAQDNIVSGNIPPITVKESDLEIAYKRRENKTPHDASIFVGRYSTTHFDESLNAKTTPSLPTNIDQTELARLLSEHLSEHTEVKNIKVVRDSKGGVCAFVQCEVSYFHQLLTRLLGNRRVFLPFRTRPSLLALSTLFILVRPVYFWAASCATSPLVLSGHYSSPIGLSPV